MPTFKEIAHTVALDHSVFTALYMNIFQAEVKLITEG